MVSSEAAVDGTAQNRKQPRPGLERCRHRSASATPRTRRVCASSALAQAGALHGLRPTLQLKPSASLEAAPGAVATFSSCLRLAA